VPANSVSDVNWLNGLPLHRATELLAPEAWAEYRSKYIPVFIIEDPASVRAFEEGKLAESNAQDALLDLVRSRQIELRALHPRANPEGKWVRLSSDIVSALTAADVDLENSTIRSPDGSTCSVWAFPVAEQAAEAAPSPQYMDAADVEPQKRKPVKLRIAEAFDRLTEAERALVNQRGGVKILERALHQALSDVPYPSLQREFRQLRSHSQGELGAGKRKSGNFPRKFPLCRRPKSASINMADR
jgi:hypothetical protein